MYGLVWVKIIGSLKLKYARLDKVAKTVLVISNSYESGESFQLGVQIIHPFSTQHCT